MSLAMRECGLKLTYHNSRAMIGQSLAMRECGLKRSWRDIDEAKGTSLAMRECGLKLSFVDGGYCFCAVTRYARVWIETILLGVLGILTCHSLCASVD